ncbi:hypothetical protein PIB30_095497 [Stylosanthes scabra]|uniref:CCHC-type domain-containing protein n=1 Tax=Stylosanthes scabra TaxID=79078 RepID=A0ABU6WTZ9_9FABA|nr:hypothetical protein [Stylosanthes scabra]
MRLMIVVCMLFPMMFQRLLLSLGTGLSLPGDMPFTTKKRRQFRPDIRRQARGGRGRGAGGEPQRSVGAIDFDEEAEYERQEDVASVAGDGGATSTQQTHDTRDGPVIGEDIPVDDAFFTGAEHHFQFSFGGGEASSSQQFMDPSMDFIATVYLCQRVDECCRRLAVARNARSNMPSRNFSRHFAPQGRNFKGRRQPFRSFSQGGGGQNRPNAGGNGGYRSGDAPRLMSGQSGRQCLKCKGYHGNEPCRAGGITCYNCGKPGHIARDCHVAPRRSGELSQR